MLLSLQNTQSLITIVLMLCAYGISATLTEASQAWVSRKMGDSAAADEGWLSLNPFDHMDFIGTLLVIFFRFAWVRAVPMYIHEPVQDDKGARFWKRCKWLFIYSTQGFAALAIAIFSLAALVLIFGVKSIGPAFSMLRSESAPLTEFAHLYPTSSSLAIVGALFLISLVVYNMFLATVSFIAHTFRYIMAVRSGSGSAPVVSDMTVWVIVFLLLILFFDQVWKVFITLVTYSALLIGKLFGAF